MAYALPVAPPGWTFPVLARELLGISDKQNTAIFLRQVSLMAQMVKNLPAVQETRVQSLGWEDPLEKGMATHSNILV